MYVGVARIFKRYWNTYGGFSALRVSFYLHVAVALLVLTVNTWIAPTCLVGSSCNAWWDQSLSILPNLLGFTLGGFAIFIGFGDEKFKNQLAAPEHDPSKPTIYLSLCATFVHFITVQVLALVVAIVAKSWWFYASWMDPLRDVLPWLNAFAGAVGYGLFLYALTSVLAATMHVFRIATMYEAHQRYQVKKDSAANDGK